MPLMKFSVLAAAAAFGAALALSPAQAASAPGEEIVSRLTGAVFTSGAKFFSFSVQDDRGRRSDRGARRDGGRGDRGRRGDDGRRADNDRRGDGDYRRDGGRDGDRFDGRRDNDRRDADRRERERYSNRRDDNRNRYDGRGADRDRRYDRDRDRYDRDRRDDRARYDRDRRYDRYDRYDGGRRGYSGRSYRSYGFRHGHGPHRGHGYYCNDHLAFHYYSGFDPVGWAFAVHVGYYPPYGCRTVERVAYRGGRRLIYGAVQCDDDWGYPYIVAGSEYVYRTY
ncbi:MAG: hypothetical protein AB7P23_08955 [Amphiplicatus sp.]